MRKPRKNLDFVFYLKFGRWVIAILREARAAAKKYKR